MAELVDRLLATPLAAALGESAVRALAAQASLRKLQQGQYLFCVGDAGDALFVVLTGRLEVVLGKLGRCETVVATLGAGQVVGELEVMTGSARVASLLAIEACELLELKADTLAPLLAQNDVAANRLVATIARSLARRLAAVNQRIIAKAPPPPPVNVATTVPDDIQVEEVEAEELIVEDADLDVLDKLWT